VIEDPHDRRLALSAVGLLETFNRAGVLDAAAVHVATRLGAMVGETSPDVLLATGLAVRAVQQGSVCVDLRTIDALPLEEDAALPWPDVELWLPQVAASPLVAQTALRFDEGLLYLDRYWREEGQVCADLLARLDRQPPEIDEEVLEKAALRVFPDDEYAEQRAAARAAAHRWTTVLTGGPGTGKTTTVAGLIALLAEQYELATGERARIALAAPTGKASARMQQAVEGVLRQLPAEDQARLGTLHATTLHRLLGWLPDSNVRFRHHRHNRLPYDIVVVDEASMVSLTMMARLLEALRPTTRLALVGDPDQLASVDAGAVLADLVEGLEAVSQSPVDRLLGGRRFESGIDALARALRAGDADAVLEVLASGSTEVSLVDPEDGPAMAAFEADVLAAALGVRLPAEAGDGAAAVHALDQHRLLCAHREGPYGVAGWNRRVERMVGDATGVNHYEEWYAGRPVLVTANDRSLGLYNGDMGVAVREPDGRLRVLVPTVDGLKPFATTRLPDVQTMHAMTVHKSQGSQAQTVSVILPPEDSALLTRELFYTAVTRAQRHVRVVGTQGAVRAAVERQVQRATGLRQRLLGGS
jgi:exodeoxyribonuclease V alpha subunit